MWNRKKSIVLSKFCVLCFIAAVLAAAVSCPALVKWLIRWSIRDIAGMELFFYVTLYTGCIPALALLWDLYGVLQRISRDAVFVDKNVQALRRISWCCFLGGAVCLVSTVYYLPFILIAFAAAFVGLIVRVVKNVFAQAVWLQQEVDGTI